MGAADESIGELVQQLVADGKDVARSELALAKARLAWRVAAARTGAIAGAGAIAFFHLFLIALVIGLLLVLAQALGPGWATLIVTGVLLAGAAILGFFAYLRFKTAFGQEPS